MHTYIIGNERMWKIGRTQNVQSRLRRLQLMSPAPLTVLATWPVDIEMQMHLAFAGWRRHGEWFALGDLVYEAEKLGDARGGRARRMGRAQGPGRRR